MSERCFGEQRPKERRLGFGRFGNRFWDFALNALVAWGRHVIHFLEVVWLALLCVNRWSSCLVGKRSGHCLGPAALGFLARAFDQAGTVW